MEWTMLWKWQKEVASPENNFFYFLMCHEWINSCSNVCGLTIMNSTFWEITPQKNLSDWCKLMLVCHLLPSCYKPQPFIQRQKDFNSWEMKFKCHRLDWNKFTHTWTQSETCTCPFKICSDLLFLVTSIRMVLMWLKFYFFRLICCPLSYMSM